MIFLAFLLRNDPEKFGDFLIKKMSLFLQDSRSSKETLIDTHTQLFPLTQNPEMNQLSLDFKRGQKLVHLIYAVGEIAYRFLFYFEKVDAELQKKKAQKLGSEEQDELQRAIGGAEAEYEEEKRTLQNIINQILEEDNLLFEFLKLCLGIIEEELRGGSPSNDVLFVAAVNTLVKFMLVNQSVCEKNLSVLNSLLEHRGVS